MTWLLKEARSFHNAGDFNSTAANLETGGGWYLELVFYRLYLVQAAPVSSPLKLAGKEGANNFTCPVSERLTGRLRIPRLVGENTGRALCLAVVIITLVICIPARQHIPYYHMIDSYDYEAFTWIGENVSDDYGKAVLDPWKATAFAAITEKGEEVM